MAPLVSVCDRHPERPALAQCVDCRRPICAACSTRWEGLHLCVDCLARRRATVVARGSVFGWLAAVVVIVGLALLATFGRTLAGVLHWAMR